LTKNNDVALGPLEDFIGFYLRRAYEKAFSDFSDILGNDSLRPGNFTLLVLIHENPGITQVEICRAAGRDKSGVTLSLRQMEDDELIERIRVEGDRRSYASYITPKGRELYARVLEKGEIHKKQLDDRIGADKKAEMIDLLKKLIDEN
jgi:DNA-binding MarR family transcriptional regulator